MNSSNAFPEQDNTNRRTSIAFDDALGALFARLGAEPPLSIPEHPDGWAGQLESELLSVGYRVQWLASPLVDARALARPDLPVLTRADDGSWWLLDDRLLGFVRATRLADPHGPRWFGTRGLADRIGSASRPWASIEPVLPASAMSGHRSPMRRLLALVRTERSDVGVIVLFAATAGGFALASPIAIQVLINWLAFGALVQPIVGLGAVLLVCLTLAAAAAVMQRIVLETLERRIFVRIVADLSARLPRARLSVLDGVDGEELANRFFDVLTLQKAAGTLLLDGVTAALQVAVALVLLGLYHPWLLLFDLLLVCGVAVVLVPHLRAAVDTAVVESKKKYLVAGWIEELTRRPLAFRLGGATVLAEQRADALTRKWLVARNRHFGVYLRQVVGIHALQVLASAGLLVACGALVLQGELTLGQLVAAEFVLATALLGLVKFTDKLDTVYDLLAGLDKVGTLLDVPAEPQRGSTARAGAAGARVLAHEVSARRLRPISFELEPGSRTAVRAAAGRGKSTLAELVVGVRTAETGRIELDGVPADRWAPDTRYGDALLLRVDTLVQSSIRDNLALGRAVPDDTLWAALGVVGLAERVRALPEALDQGLGSHGSPLSSAEVRALLVARAVVIRPRLLVVDGCLDGLGREGRARLLAPICAPDAPWTLLLLTAEAEVARATPHTLTLEQT